MTRLIVPEKPPHPIVGQIICECTSCEEWRFQQLTPVVSGTLVIGIMYHRFHSTLLTVVPGSHSWGVNEEFNWGWGPPIDMISMVVGSMPPGCSGTHLNPIVVLTPNRGLRVVRREQLLIVSIESVH